ncbi:uncharacterized protein LAJ45_05033 [Morchella importuna]|uniref:uncharacterized protein n=1 Tax=Morchella importuna TaxID=1174673 RepID=UPI001E8D8FFE|nr:uncharacterized protein LAJ45_05033 [Morchella importuna]KAH8150852.1 hypothetical protein LAJ45_05033 [Morchella importuna]
MCYPRNTQISISRNLFQYGNILFLCLCCGIPGPVNPVDRWHYATTVEIAHRHASNVALKRDVIRRDGLPQTRYYCFMSRRALELTE